MCAVILRHKIPYFEWSDCCNLQTGSCSDYQSNNGTTSISQDCMDQIALDDNN